MIHFPQYLASVNEKVNYEYMGVSENSVPLHPMVNDHYPY